MNIKNIENFGRYKELRNSKGKQKFYSTIDAYKIFYVFYIEIRLYYNFLQVANLYDYMKVS
jgi:hypothetical protein